MIGWALLSTCSLKCSSVVGMFTLGGGGGVEGGLGRDSVKDPYIAMIRNCTKKVNKVDDGVKKEPTLFAFLESWEKRER